MISRSSFEYYDILNSWMYLSYSISQEQYDIIDYKELSDLINFSEKNFEILESLSQESILKYAKEIEFFSDEEFEDLEFEYIDTVFNVKNGKLVSFTRTYSVSENEETTKIFWKDVYGVWKVTFKGCDIIKVVRENS